MKIEYDNIADAMYIRYSRNKIISTKESDQWIVDYDSNGDVVGIEMLWVKSLFEKNNIDINLKSELEVS